MCQDARLPGLTDSGSEETSDPELETALVDPSLDPQPDVGSNAARDVDQADHSMLEVHTDTYRNIPDTYQIETDTYKCDIVTPLLYTLFQH